MAKKIKGHYEKVRDEYATWLAIPKQARKSAGLPTTQAEFAELKGTTSRTLRRWAEDQEFLTLVEQRRAKFALEALPNSAIASTARPRPATDPRIARRLSGPEPLEGVLHTQRGVVDYAPVETQDERDYLAVKNRILDKAINDDNLKAQEAFLRIWGKPFVEAELSDDLGLGGMSDAELVREFVALMGEDLTAEVLAAAAADRTPKP